MVGSRDLDQARRAQGTEIHPGDVVLVRTGSDTVWGEPDRYLNGAGMSGDASEWLAGQGVSTSDQTTSPGICPGSWMSGSA
jgi:kynurenine formamidase